MIRTGSNKLKANIPAPVSFSYSFALVSFQVSDFYLSKKGGKKISMFWKNCKMEMLKCINQLTGRSSWQQGKWFQETASFLKGQKVSGSPKLLNLFYHVTSIKTVLAATFLNVKTSTVWRSLNIQASDAGMESKRTEINWQHPESILLQHLTKLPKTGLVVVIMLITERTMVLHHVIWVPCSPWFLLVVFLVFFFFYGRQERKQNVYMLIQPAGKTSSETGCSEEGCNVDWVDSFRTGALSSACLYPAPRWLANTSQGRYPAYAGNSRAGTWTRVVA